MNNPEMKIVGDNSLTEQKQAEKNPAEQSYNPAAEDLESEKASHPKEHGGPKGLEPTRYGDWERRGRCTDF